MKKLSLVILISFFFLSFLTSSFAHEEDVKKEAPKVAPVEYELPYPGILPDNPLYFLKAIRDNLLGAFITDPLKKAEYTLLMSDKRLGSAKLLVDEGKGDLAITTLSKSGNYFHESLNKIAEAKRQGEDTNGPLNKLLTASKKHQEVISEMVLKTKGETKTTLLSLRERTQKFQSMVEDLKSK